MRRPDGPTAKVIEYARAQPGGIITWSEAQVAYAKGRVPSYDGTRGGAYHHKMSISNVLRKHFERVEGLKGTYVLRSTISNPDWDEDMDALQAFHNLYGADEFGMSTREGATWPFPDVQIPFKRVTLTRMSDIGSDWSGASVTIVGGDFDGADGRIT